MALVPFVSVQAIALATIRGSISHLSHLEYGTLCAAAGLTFLLLSVAVLLALAAITGERRSLAAVVASLLFAATGTLAEPRMWANFLAPIENGIGYWLFITGAGAALLFRFLPSLPQHVANA